MTISDEPMSHRKPLVGVPPPNPALGCRRVSQTPRPGVNAARTFLARSDCTAREHEARPTRNRISSHTCSDRPLPTCKTSIVVTARIFTVFKADTKETTKEVTSFVVAAEGRHLCIIALNKVNIVAVTTIFVVHVGNGRFEHV